MPSEPGITTERLDLGACRALCGTGKLFAVADVCGRPAIPRMCRTLGPSRALSLYGRLSEAGRDDAAFPPTPSPGAERYERVSPYLIHLDERVFDWLTGPSLWQEPWGIFIHCRADLLTLRSHLRRFTLVKGQDQKTYFFRFYDPRVLPTFLQSSGQADLASFFGPVQAYGVRSDDAVSLMRFRPD